MFDLNRFVEAQDRVYDRVLEELRNGRKTSHWMWYIFPQIAGLGHSATAVHYAIASRAEAAAYLDHAVLGSRLRQCTALVNAIADRSISGILGTPDDVKFRSSMTLFCAVTEDRAVFAEALTLYFDGKADPATLALL